MGRSGPARRWQPRSQIRRAKLPPSCIECDPMVSLAQHNMNDPPSCFLSLRRQPFEMNHTLHTWPFVHWPLNIHVGNLDFFHLALRAPQDELQALETHCGSPCPTQVKLEGELGCAKPDNTEVPPSLAARLHRCLTDLFHEGTNTTATYQLLTFFGR